MCVYLERFTITPIKDIAPLYYLFNYVTKEEEHKALQLKGIKDFALKLVSIFKISACFKGYFITKVVLYSRNRTY